MVVAESRILLALPVLASFNASTLLELHRWGFCGVWLFRNAEVLRLNWLARGNASRSSLARRRRLGCSFVFTRFCCVTSLSLFSGSFCSGDLGRVASLRRVTLVLF